MKKAILVINILLCLCPVGIFGQKPKKAVLPPSPVPESSDFRSPFRYVVVSDVTGLQKSVNNNPYNWHLEVILDDKAFNEKNLTELFTLLSKRFADRPGLFINLFTSLEALRTPEEHDDASLWGLEGDYQNYKYAIFSRNGHGERFRYGIPGLESKEVVIKRPPAVWPPK